jgi:NAD(P)-dependent dehydrogenase (short-subunit alcohol dehydrogenase family)
MRSIIITGGGRGIGAATSLLAAARGYGVVVDYTSDAEAASRTVAEITGAGGRAIAHRADVSRHEDVVALFDAACSEFGSVDALVNNATIIGPYGRLDGDDPAAPGLILTDMQRERTDIDVDERAAGLPIGRAGRVEEVAESILWLLSDSASYVAGAVLAVAGGVPVR